MDPWEASNKGNLYMGSAWPKYKVCYSCTAQGLLHENFELRFFHELIAWAQALVSPYKIFFIFAAISQRYIVNTFRVKKPKKCSPSRRLNLEGVHFPGCKTQKGVHFPHIATQKAFTFRILQPKKCPLSAFRNPKSVHFPHFATQKVFTFRVAKVFIRKLHQCTPSLVDIFSSMQKKGGSHLCSWEVCPPLQLRGVPTTVWIGGSRAGRDAA